MIKSELITTIARKLHHVNEKDISTSINHILDHMSGALAQGGRIEIRGFGSFSLHYRPPRNAHNPKTGERLVTISKHTPHFKPGKEMRQRVNASSHLPIKEELREEPED